MRPTIVFGDVHLTTRTPAAIGLDLARLVSAHPGARLVACGDLFDCSADQPDAEPADAVVTALRAHPPFVEALVAHLEAGGELVLLAGNHDAVVGTPGFVSRLTSALGLSPAAASRVVASPWFVRDGALHLEHGHLYDQDNATEHPLVDGAPSLGVHFVRSFIAPTGAFAYLNTNDDTPLKLFLAAFRWYGRRGPYVVYRYFRAAFEAMAMSGALYRAGGEAAEGEARMDAFAREAGVSRDLADAARAQIARSTLRSTRATVSRLYFDRVVATVSTMAGCAGLAIGWRSPTARRRSVALALAGLAGLGASWMVSYDRFGGTVPDRLRAGARRLRDATGAELVVLGHAHQEALEPGYANTGSFSFPGAAPGRPYLVVEQGEEGPRATRRHLAPP